MREILNKLKRIKDAFFIMNVNRISNSNIHIKTKINERTVFEGENTIGINCDVRGTLVSLMSYMGDNCRLVNSSIGKFCAIASDVNVIYGQHPTSKFLSIHDIFYSKNGYRGISLCKENYYEEYRFSNKGFFVEIGNDVWIGEGARLMEGIRIGNGAIIAAGTLVTKNVPDYAIVGGVPGKINKIQI